MKIFILRHGQAEAYHAHDAARQLTEKGISDTHCMLSNNAQHLVSVRTICASPLVRAQQTAAIAQELLNIKTLNTISCLEPEANFRDVFSFLETVSDTDIFLVSHLPLVGIVANRLCGFDQNHIQFNTSTLIGIECDFPAEGMGHLFLERHI